jgi:hypothetical protein
MRAGTPPEKRSSTEAFVEALLGNLDGTGVEECAPDAAVREHL